MKNEIEFEFLTGNKVTFLKESIMSSKFHISNVLSDIEEENPILIHEDEKASLSIFYSIHFKKFIRYKFCCLELVKALAEKWDVEDWLIEEINNNLTIINEEKKYFQCSLCGCFYKEEENYLTSCNFHPGLLDPITSKFTCCGYTSSYGCKEGYHGKN